MENRDPTPESALKQRIVFLRLLATLAFMCAGTHHAHCEEIDYDREIRRAILWLPAETESLMVSREKCEFIEGFEPSAPCGAGGALHVIRRGKFQKRMEGHPVLFAANGSCRFRGPDSGVGPVRYSGSQIVVFAKNIKDATVELLGEMAADADERIEIKGRDVLRFNEKWNDDTWTFFLTFPTPNVLVVSTSEDYLRNLIGRIDDPPDRSFLEHKELNENLPLSAELWAVREYGADSGPAKSIGFVFAASDGEEALIQHFVKEKVPLESVSKLWQLWPPDDTAAEIVSVEDNRFEFRHSCKDNVEQFAGVLMLLGWRLGHEAASK